MGVDLGTASLKIVELKHSSGGFSLKNYGLLELYSQEIAKMNKPNQDYYPEIKDFDITYGLKELINKTKFTTKICVAAIPSFSTFSTIIQLPYLSEKDLEKAIPFEAKKYIPLPLDEVVLDWSIINVQTRQEEKNKNSYPNVEVFLTAVAKDEIERYKNIFNKADLTLKALELESTALIRSLIGDDQNAFAILNLGGITTSIIIVDKGFERISHNYEFGGFKITNTIARILGIGFNRADKIKREEGLKRMPQSLVKAILPLIDMMIFETKKTIANYEENKGLKIKKIILTGGQAALQGLDDYISKKIERPVSIENPFNKVSFDKNLAKTLKKIGPSFSVAVGLAMRKI